MPSRRLEASRSGNMPASISSSSLSSAASSMLPAAPPSNSSQSDIVPTDLSAHSSLSLNTRTANTPHLILGGPRSSSLNASFMGQTQSRPLPPAPAPPSPKATSRFKRVFGAARRKKSDLDGPALDLPPVQPLKVKGKARDASPGPRPAPVDVPPPPFAYGQQPKPHPSLPSPDSAGIPPTPPPKPAHMQPTPPRTMLTTTVPRGDQRTSFMATSPLSAALEYITTNEEKRPEEGADPAQPASRPSQERRDSELERTKEDWRKSDSTTTSYYTVRPRSGTSGTRTPRPVSMAESLQSTNTIVAPTRRMSALITDSEYATPEEDFTVESHSSGHARAALSRQASPSGSAKARKRQSISLSLSSPFPFSSDARRSPPQNGRQRPGIPPASTSDVPTLTRTAANGIIAPSRAEDFPSSTGSQIKGKLSAWSAASSTSPPPQVGRLPEPPGSPTGRSSSSSSQTQGQRQPAVSISGGLAPVAGFAMGFGRRAMERMGRAINNLGGHAHSHASSSSSSLSGDDALARTQSNLSAASHLAAPPPRGKHWRTPNAPSGAWSISTTGTGSSSLSHSDSDVLGLATGPNLGRRRRGPMRAGGGNGAPVAGGLVFGRELATCVRDTAIDPVRLAIAERGTLEGSRPGDPLEKRMLPALVVRCAQHLLRWGVEEEGLFRISGRASHIAKLRTEFDTGADYDLREATPGDLDPHAVSSIFKAYLRELPEPILTHALNPYFEAAMVAETNARKGEEAPPAQPHRLGMRGPSALPTNPRDGHALRKPPSLSTLAMPSFAGMRPPSASLLKTFAMLVARLPPANRDLLRTVTELINATSSRKETRMPLSNLTVIFCPSLNMNPPILRVLCESREVWEGAARVLQEQEQVVDLKRESVLDIRADEAQDDGGEDRDGQREEERQGTGQAEPEQPVVAPERTVSPEAIPASSDDADAEDTSAPSSTLDDAASSASRPATPPLYNPHSPQSTHGLSSSESLATPSTLSEDPPPPCQYAGAEKTRGPQPPAIAEPGPHPPLASAETRPTPVIVVPPPVAFPSTERGLSSPVSPPPPPPPAATHSPAISLTSREMPSPAGSTHSRTGRMKRPSLSALFSKKRSASSLGGARASTSAARPPMPSPTDSGSPCTPLSADSMVTAPTGSGSRFSLPPLLDTKIDSSSLSLVLGIEDEAEAEATAGRAVSSVCVESPGAAGSPTPESPASATPTGAQFRASGGESFVTAPSLRPQLSGASAYSRLSVWDDEEDVPPDEDWASSVLQEAAGAWAERRRSRLAQLQGGAA